MNESRSTTSAEAARTGLDVTDIEMPSSHAGLGDIVELKDGTLLFALHNSPVLVPNRGILARTSTDRGRTWSEQSVLVPHLRGGAEHEQAAYGHPSLLRLPNGDIEN